MSEFLKKFMTDERGATAIEYAIIATGLSIAIIAAVATLGEAVKGDFEEVGTSLK